MLYGEDKDREMARSILPSKARKGAHDDRRLINRSHRRASRQRIVTDVDRMDGVVLPDRELRARQSEMVGARRDADHLNHYFRWAEVQVADVPQRSRLTQIRAMLPDGLIGMHAADHLRFRDEFTNPDDRSGYQRLTPEERRAYKRLRSLHKRAIRRAVTNAFTTDLAALNRLLKAASMEPVRADEDIEPLVERICKWTEATGMPWEPLARHLRLIA